MEQSDRERKEPKIGEKVIQGFIVGRDKTVIDPEEVRKLAAIGCKDTEIAAWFGITDQTLRYNFQDFLTKGREQMKQTLRRTMLEIAVQGKNTVMCIFLAKNWLGMSDNPTNTEDSQPLPWTDDTETALPTVEITATEVTENLGT